MVAIQLGSCRFESVVLLELCISAVLLLFLCWLILRFGVDLCKQRTSIFCDRVVPSVSNRILVPVDESQMFLTL